MTVGELLAEEALGLAGVNVARSPDGALTWSRGGQTFATLSADGAIASFNLDPPVATAAIRTPDVQRSPLGPGWVAFTPVELDDHAADRAVAWFASGHRRLGPRD